MTRRTRFAAIVAVLVLLAPFLAAAPGGLWLLAPAAVTMWWAEKSIARSAARDRWMDLDCTAAIRGSHRRPEAAQAAMRRHNWSPERQALLRHLQVFGESAHLVRNSRNQETVDSRRGVAIRARSEAIAMRHVLPGSQFWGHLERHAAELSPAVNTAPGPNT